MVSVRAFGDSDVGRVREHNEDSYLINDQMQLFIVADGMGGRASGEVASAEAVEQVYEVMHQRRADIDAAREAPDDEETRAKVHRALEAAVQAATYMIFGMGQFDPSHKGMGTTISGLIYLGDGRGIVAQVGDSRVYRVRNREAEQITEDHTLVNLKIKMGVMTKEQAKKSREGHLITRAVGVKDYVNVDTIDIECQPGDRYLLCSDGLSDYLQDLDEVARYVGAQTSMPDVARSLIALANARGGKDNITAVIVEVY